MIRTPKRAHSTDSVRAAFSSAAPTALACSPASVAGARKTTLPPVEGAPSDALRDPRRVDHRAHDVPAIVDRAPQPGHPAAGIDERRGGIDHQHIDVAERSDGDRDGVLVGEVTVDRHHARTERGSALPLGRAVADDAERQIFQDTRAQHVEHGADPTSRVCAMKPPSPRALDLPLAGGRPPGASTEGVRVHPLQTARMKAMPDFWQRPGGPKPLAIAKGFGLHIPRSRWVWLPIPAFLVEHPTAGPFLVDAGLHEQVATDVGAALGRMAKLAFIIDMQPEEAVPHQLRERGIDPDAIELIVMTHLHSTTPAGSARSRTQRSSSTSTSGKTRARVAR